MRPTSFSTSSRRARSGPASAPRRQPQPKDGPIPPTPAPLPSARPSAQAAPRARGHRRSRPRRRPLQSRGRRTFRSGSDLDPIVDRGGPTPHASRALPVATRWPSATLDPHGTGPQLAGYRVEAAPRRAEHSHTRRTRLASARTRSIRRCPVRAVRELIVLDEMRPVGSRAWQHAC